MSRQSAYDARRLASGWRRVPVWLDPETNKVLDGLKRELETSEQEAIRWALRNVGR
jgi:hypothetical protein